MTTYTISKITTGKCFAIDVEADNLREVMAQAKKLVGFRETVARLNSIMIHRPDQTEGRITHTLAIYRARYEGSRQYSWTIIDEQ